MNTLTPTRPLLPQPARADDSVLGPGLAAVTVLAVALDTPGKGSAHRIEFATVVLRHTGAGYAERGRLRCLLHAGMPAALVAEHCRLPLAHVHDRTPATVALSMLERHLTAPPYLLVAHHAGQLSSLIDRHRDDCPTLAATPLLDTAGLARRLLPVPTTHSVRDLAGALMIPRPHRASHTTEDAALTACVYQVLLAAALRRRPTLDLPTLLGLGCARDEADPLERHEPDRVAALSTSAPRQILRGPHG
jgi:DNA polymerase-3 subunit epsilon